LTLDAEPPEQPWSAGAALEQKGNEKTSQPDALSQHAAIYHLADEGYSTTEICKQTGRLAGEIELILSLRKATPTA
jgi:hypothetical protein